MSTSHVRTHRTRRTAALTALASVTTMAGLACGSADAVAATAQPAHASLVARAKPLPYRATVVAPRHRADGTATGDSSAVGVSDAGAVSGNATGQGESENARRTLPFVNTGRRASWLKAAIPVQGDPSATSRATASDVSPNGLVAASFDWARMFVGYWTTANALRLTQPLAPDSGGYGARADAINRNGQVAGCVDVVKVSYPVIWSAAGVPSKPLVDRTGNCRITGLADTGSAAMTLHNPYFRNDGKYPNAYLVTSSGSYTLTPGDSSTIATADGISPNGKRIVGRVGGSSTDGGTAAWLSTTRAPVRLTGAGDLVPSDVNDAGSVVGTSHGRAVLWSQGRLTDLTTSTSGLPAGWVVVSADGINASGTIAATAKDPRTGHTAALRISRR